MLWELLAAFVLAATPWIELLFVIPIGLAWGIPPLPLAAVVFAGNTISILPIVWLYDRWHAWRVRRREEKGVEDGQPRSRRGAMAQRLWNRYGLPGLAMLAPLVTGVHLAVAIALLSKAPRKSVLYWMIGSIAVWTIGWTILSALGVEGVRMLWR